VATGSNGKWQRCRQVTEKEMSEMGMDLDLDLDLKKKVLDIQKKYKGNIFRTYSPS